MVEALSSQNAIFYKSNSQPPKEIDHAKQRIFTRRGNGHCPTIGVPLDPDVADHLGAFVEEAITLADIVEDGLLDGRSNPHGGPTPGKFDSSTIPLRQAEK